MGCMRPVCAPFLLRISCVSAPRLAGSRMGGCKGSITGPSGRSHVVGYPIWGRTVHWRGSFLIRQDYRIFRQVILVGYRGLGRIRPGEGRIDPMSKGPPKDLAVCWCCSRVPSRSGRYWRKRYWSRRVPMKGALRWYGGCRGGMVREVGQAPKTEGRRRSDGEGGRRGEGT
jgi:hypothetical protein